MSQQQAARTPGAKRAGNGEYVFDLAKVNHIPRGARLFDRQRCLRRGRAHDRGADAHAGRHRR